MTFLGDHNLLFSIFGEDPVLFLSMAPKLSTKDMKEKVDEYAGKYV